MLTSRSKHVIEGPNITLVPLLLLLIAFLGISMLPAFVSAQQINDMSSGKVDTLQIPVTMTVSGQTLNVILKKIDSNQSPHILAGGEAQRERLTIYTHDLLRIKFMNDLSHLLNYPWAKDILHDPPTKYTLWRDAHTKDYEQNLLRQTLERGAASLFHLTSYLKYSREDCERVYDQLQENGKHIDDPLLDKNLFYLKDPVSRSGLELFSTLSSDQIDTLLNDGILILNAKTMTEHQRRLARDCGMETDRINALIGRTKPDEGIADSAQLAINIGLTLRVGVDTATSAILGYQYGYNVDADFRNLPFPQDILHVRGNPYKQRPEDKLPVYPALQQMPFPQKFKLEVAQSRPWREVMEELSKHLSIPLFSDDYSFLSNPQDREGAPLPDLSKLNLVQGLDALCNHYRYLWWYEDGALFFRSRIWFKERQYEVPLPVLNLVRDHLQSRGKFDPESLTLLSTLSLQQLQGFNVDNSVLTATQLNGTKTSFPVLSSQIHWLASGGAIFAYYYLKMFALLTEAQKEKVLSPNGLPFSEMTLEQQQAFVYYLYIMREREGISALSQACFKATQQITDGVRLIPDPDSPKLPVRQQKVRQARLTFSDREHEWGMTRILISYVPKEPVDSPQK